MGVCLPWRFDCPEGCGFYFDVSVDSGTGEGAARAMDRHCQKNHDTRFPAWKKKELENTK